MKKLLIPLLIIIVVFACNNKETHKSEAKKTILEIKDGAYYINGQKFFVNALGYEIGARPGQNPKYNRKLELARMKMDLEAIKNAGFNTIRTWDVLYKEELELVQSLGLKVIFGIETESKGDYSDPVFIDKCVQQVESALSYSKDFDCIITYLIMNEPMPDHINKVGAKSALDLWEKLAKIIHEKHPGIPVTISGNSAITEWLNMNIFDIYSYNAYDYGSGINYALNGKNAFEFLKDMNKQNKPLIFTEFGLSVSRDGHGKYGTNTLKGQEEGLVQSYRDLLDAGAAGCCPFYYADGWWKGGDSCSHRDTPEEWFGFWGYSDLKDTIGHPRPVWYALKTYNEALIASPKNQTFYQNKVPIEIFPQPEVEKMRVIYHDKTIYESKAIHSGYFTDTLSFAGDTLTDRDLVFEFYDKGNKLLKYETIVILTGKDQIQWPTLEINADLKDLSKGKNLAVQLTLKNGGIFKLPKDVRYIFQHHIGWEPGEGKTEKIDPKKKEQTLSLSYKIEDKSLVLGIYAGAEISYGKFVMTIYDNKFIFRGDWAELIRVK